MIYNILTSLRNNTIDSLAAVRAKSRCCGESTTEIDILLYGFNEGGSNSPNLILAEKKKLKKKANSRLVVQHFFYRS